ncbi:heme-degrading domain-containing protein [Deinococcus roseus]|uniref:UPF0303 protein GCM10008938_20350 n=1 Tax=Deinococcus roseus TaxID=392414 RepID=A0ABQ2D1E7_9DEIO|nr:heme-degrading domain-containing protein [Deinococcus roseus]GGJ34058.1 UPF0303 protein R02983 [Deinococcus roseus]
MNLQTDIQRIQQQEETLRFEAFDFDTAWELGNAIREIALQEGKGVVIDIHRLDGLQLFFTALPGTNPDNLNWVRRKANVVRHFQKSSYQIGQDLKARNTTVTEAHGLSDADHATHGGAFPIVLKTGEMVGVVTVSGVPQREDHALVVKGLCKVLDQDHDTLKLD